MRISRSLLLVLALLSARGTVSDICFKPSGNNLELTQGCTSSEATVFSKSDEFNVTIDAGRGGVKSQGMLKIGDCSVKLELLGSNTGNVLNVNDREIKLPTTATVKQGSFEFFRNNEPAYDVPCFSTFKQVDDGNTIDVEYSMSPPASNLSMILTGVSIYSKRKNDGSPKVGIILAVLGIALLLSACIGVGFVIFRRWKSKEQEKRAKEEDEARLAKEESEMKKAEVKKVEVKKVEVKKVEVRKAETEEPKTIAKKKKKKLKAKKAEPVAKQVDETKSKDLEEVLFAKQVKVRKQHSPPSQDWTFTPSGKRSRKNKCKCNRACNDKESHKEKVRVARRILSRKRSSKADKLAISVEVRIDEVFPDSNEEQITTAIFFGVN